MKQLIVNADDFGMTEGVNQGILEAHRKGIVTSTTLLATGAAFEAAVAAGCETPRLGIGVHLNLSEGLPVSPAAAIPTLVDARGRLHLTPGKLWMAMAGGRVLRGRMRREMVERDIEVELRAQVLRIVEAGVVPTHLDGHMHVHVLPGVSEIVIKIAREFHISAVRCPVERIGGPLRPPSRNAPGDFPGSRLGSHSLSKPTVTTPVISRWLVTPAVSWSARRLRRLLVKAALSYPARFYGIAQTGFLDLPAIRQILRSLPEGSSASDAAASDPITCELMCHPGYVDGALAQVGGSLQQHRESELLALTSPEAASLVADEGIRLVTYRELRG